MGKISLLVSAKILEHNDVPNSANRSCAVKLKDVKTSCQRHNYFASIVVNYTFSCNLIGLQECA